MNSLRKALSSVFDLASAVDRKTYAIVGFVLMPIKLGVDAGLLRVATGQWQNPLEFLGWGAAWSDIPTWCIQAMILWALPYAWIGLSMSVRRAIDAGLSPWIGVLFCIPLWNFGLMLFLCLMPSRPYAHSPDWDDRSQRDAFLRAVGTSLLVALFSTMFGVFVIGTLGVALFAAAPLAMGFVGGYSFNRGTLRSVGSTTMVAVVSVVVTGAVVLLFAIEGVLCIVMALPLAMPLAILGALVGRGSTRVVQPASSPLFVMLIALAQLATVEPLFVAPGLQQVTTRVQIDADAARVWDHLISFQTIDPPTEFIFRAGISYPTRARIVGKGVGATRYCEFSTGAFVEPITEWDEPHVLSFDVTDQPEPLRELSPYPRVHINHLDGSLVSKRGQFKLLPSPGGGTILEGSTWYEVSIFPEFYWEVWTDHFIRSIHLRVLGHIKANAERAGIEPAARPDGLLQSEYEVFPWWRAPTTSAGFAPPALPTRRN